MKKIEVFDPPMCCKSGICGSSADPILVTFASDLEWLKKQGVGVVRHGLALEPNEFSKNENVKKILQKEGKGCLPIIILNGEIASKSTYPTRENLAKICGISFNEDEAPPIHREENCCCGVDCDCSAVGLPNGIIEEKCDCENAAAEDNCFCVQSSENKEEEVEKYSLPFFFTVFIIILLGVLTLKALF